VGPVIPSLLETRGKRVAGPRAMVFKRLLRFDPASTRCLPRRARDIERKDFLLCLRGEPLLVCAHASGGTEPHVPIAMPTKSQLAAAVVAAY